MKKFFARIFLSIVLFLSFSLVSEATVLFDFNYERLEMGLLDVSYNGESDMRLMIQKEEEKVFYYLKQDRPTETISLHLGDGAYRIAVLEKISGNSYRPVFSETINLSIKDSSKIHLNSVQEIRFNDESLAIIKAKELTENLKTDDEKITAIYKYIINNYSYDYDKASTVSSGYLPDIDDIYLSKKGICYDYASLFASMLRSVGISTKLVKGYTEHVSSYHAWNEVYVNGEWLIIDTTVDAVLKPINIFKAETEYQPTSAI